MDLLDETLKNAQQALLDARTSEGYWCGELSSSALSTATALCAFYAGPGSGSDKGLRRTD